MRTICWLIWVTVSLALSGCVTGEQSTSTPTVAPDIESKVDQIDLYCPTDSEEAKQAYNSATRLHFEAGQPDDAREIYLKAIELDPGYCDAMDNLGLLYRQAGDLAKAAHWYKRSIAVLYENPVPHMNLALVYKLQGQLEEAATEYQVLFELDPNDPEGYYGLGGVYLIQEQYRKAVEQLKKAEELYLKKSSPYVADARYGLGFAYYGLQEWSRARDYFEMVYPESADDPDLNFYLGLCYLTPELRDLELARKYLLKAQQLGVELPPEALQTIQP